MANMASVAYAIEGNKKSLTEILGAICLAIHNTHGHWEEYQTCVNLGFTEKELEGKMLGGEIIEDPTIERGVLRVYAEERWGLQDFKELLKQKFPDIKVYWEVEESGDEVYATNDKEGKYFQYRFIADVVIDGIFYYEEFIYKSDMFKWLHDITNGRVNTMDKVETFNADYEDTCAEDENCIRIHEFTVMD